MYVAAIRTFVTLKAMAERRALIIAVSNYDRLPSLDFCKNDGEILYEILKSQKYMISIDSQLIGRVSWQIMYDTVIDFFTNQNIAPDDTLVFYYSGHGVPDDQGDIYLATSEIDSNYPYKKGFSFSQLAKMMQLSISKRIVAILDCCYSGSATISKGTEESIAKLANSSIDKSCNNMIEGEGICILASSQAYEEAQGLKERNHSLFTYYLIEGLRGNQKVVDDYGRITAASLGRYIYNTIMSLSPERRPKQKPIVKMELSGEIILAHYPEYSRNTTPVTPTMSPVIDDVGKQYLDKKEYQKALEYYERTLRDPAQAKLWINKGIAHNRLHNNSEALKCFDIALDLDTSNALAWGYKGVALSNIGKHEEAIRYFQKSIDLDSMNENMWFGKAMSLFNLSRLDEALLYIDKSLDINPKGELALGGKGEILNSQGKHQEALDWYDRAIELNPTLPVPWAYKAQLFNKLGRRKEALESYDKAIEYFENYPMETIQALWNSKGNILGDLDRQNEALKCYEKAIEYNSENPVYWINKSFTLVTMRKFDDSLTCAEHAIKLSSNDNSSLTNGINIINLIGMHLCVAHRYEESLVCFDKVLTIDSKDNIATTLSKLVRENPAEARNFCLQNLPAVTSSSGSSTTGKRNI